MEQSFPGNICIMEQLFQLPSLLLPGHQRETEAAGDGPYEQKPQGGFWERMVTKGSADELWIRNLSITCDMFHDVLDAMKLWSWSEMYNPICDCNPTCKCVYLRLFFPTN